MISKKTQIVFEVKAEYRNSREERKYSLLYLAG